MNIPLTAWEQIGVVVLFTVFVIALLKWASTRERNWQSFISDRDEVWQKWMNDQNLRENETLCNVTDALARLADKLDDHDKRVDERLGVAVETIITRASEKMENVRKKKA